MTDSITSKTMTINLYPICTLTEGIFRWYSVSFLEEEETEVVIIIIWSPHVRRMRVDGIGYSAVERIF